MARRRSKSIKIFISHSTVDLEAARGIYRALRAADFRVWLRAEDLREEDIELGSSWRDWIDEVLLASDLVLFLLSRQSLEDEDQARDLDLSLGGGKRVVPAFLDADTLSGPRLGRLQVHAHFLRERRGELINSSEGLAKLIRGLQRLNQGKAEAPLQESSPTGKLMRGRLRVRRLASGRSWQACAPTRCSRPRPSACPPAAAWARSTT